ncbi:MAG: HNH endonuclease family protein, partial [Pirellula sp.]
INERIERYGKLLDAIEQGVDLYAAESPLQLSDKECRRFVTELNGDLYRQVPKRRLYVLLRLDSALSDGSATYDHSAISIEHVLPQNPSASSQWCKWFPTQELRDRWVHRLGNLLLLNHKKNSSASNYEFEKKKTAYFKKGGVSPFPLTTQAIGESEWTLKVVEARQEQAIEELKHLWRIKADVLADQPATIELDEPDDHDVGDGTESEKTGKDFTKFDVTINGVTQDGLSKRKAVLAVVKHLCDQGVTPEEIAKLVPWRTTMFCSLDGIVTSSQFVAQQKAKVDSGDKRRYFCDDDELIHSSGRTYAVTNGWGVRSLQAIQNILAKYSDKGVRCEKHTKAKE